MDDAMVASWVLLAVHATGRKGEVPIDRVVGAADAINHAVLLHGEMELAVQILEANGLVAASESALKLTEAGRSELKLADSKYWHETLTKLRNRMERLGTEERSAWRIDAGEFNAAVEAYRSRMAPRRKR